MWKQKFRDILAAQLERGRQPGKRFSMRDLSRILELSSGQLSELLHGKRPLTRKAALELLPKLFMSDEERDECRRLLNVEPLKTHLLSTDDLLELLGNPIYGKLLASLELDNGFESNEALAKKLSYNRTDIAAAWNRLVDFNIVKVSSDGFYVPVAELPRGSVHRERSARKRATLKSTQSTERIAQTKAADGPHAITRIFSGSESQTSRLVQEIERFAAELPTKAEAVETDTIFILNVQFAPIK